MSKKKIIQGSYTGVYSFDHMFDDDPKYPMAIYTSKKGEGFGTYELEMETFITLGRPDKIKVKDVVEAIE